jgi:UbiD family decarboxylase
MSVLEREGQRIRIHDEIAPEPGVRNYLRAVGDMHEDGPALLFDNLIGYKGMPLLVNTHGSWCNNALLLGMNKRASIREMFHEFERRWHSYSSASVSWVQDAPCQQEVIEGDINLYRLLPLFRINQFDGGFYLSKSSTISRDPDEPENFEKQNVGMYRIQLQGPDVLGIQVFPFHDLGIHLRKAEERQERLPVAICLGVPPVLSVVACACVRYDESEYQYASALAGEPFELTKALHSNLDVPAWAEYVLEGYIEPGVRAPEGPFGEFPGSYSGVRLQSRIRIITVTHRRNPLMENLYIGRPWTENDTLCAINTSVTLCDQLRQEMPEVVAVNAIVNHGLTVIIAMRNRFGGFAKSVAFRMASTPHGISYAKNIILVDADVDPFDLNAVMVALSTRLRADRDVAVITNTPGMPLDPASDPPGMGNKLILDATTPAPPDRMLRETRMVAPIEGAAACAQQIRQLQKVLHGEEVTI